MNRRLVAMLMASVLLVAACDSDLALAQDFIKQWALDHAVEIGKAGLGVPSGDTYVDAAVEAGKPILELKEADDDMAKGRKDSDPKAMDAALKLRPHDWAYELSRANLALQQGDMGAYEKFLEGAAHDGNTGSKSFHDFEIQDYNELLTIHHRLDRGADAITGYKSYNQCVKIYDRLEARDAGWLGIDAPQTKMWQQRLKACEQISH